MSELKVNKISPATGTAFTLGDSGDTFTVPSGATILNSGTATGFGAGGKVLKVEHTRWNGSSSYTGTSYSATPLTNFQVAITPTATTSNILIIAVLNLCSNNETDHVYAKMYRDAVQINMGDQIGSSRSRVMWNQKMGSNLGNENPAPILYYAHEIATTSSTTYSFQIATASGVTAYFNTTNVGTDAAYLGDTSSTIMAIEFAPN